MCRVLCTSTSRPNWPLHRAPTAWAGATRCRRSRPSSPWSDGPVWATAQWSSWTVPTALPPPGAGGCCGMPGIPDVRLLDGGWDVWAAAGGAVETGPGSPRPPGTYQVRWGSMPIVSAADVAAGAALLLDARAAARFRGEVEPIDPVAGHIPGAVSAPATDNLDARGYWLPEAQLRRMYTALGADGSAPVAAYCGSGVTAAHTVVALARLGIDAALYPGSWSDWITDPARPVARGIGGVAPGPPEPRR